MEDDCFKCRNDLTPVYELCQSLFSFLDKVSNDEFSIIVWNERKEVIYVSKTIDRLIGMKRDELYGKKWMKTLRGNERLIVNEFLSSEEKESHTYKDNLIEYIFSHIKFHNKRYPICHIRSKQYIKRLEEKIDEYQDRIIHTEKMAIAGEFATGLVHEIRNPLTALKGFLQLIQAGIDQKEEYYRVMIEEIEKIELITTELLTMSKPFSSKQKAVSLKKMIDDTIIVMELQEKYRQISFNIKCNEEITIQCNEQQIKQVLINLFKNASEAMEMCGNIFVNVCETDDSIELEIIDEGEGFPDDTIFELGKPFYTTKKSGTGLGLVITNQILESHGATMSICSERGEGSKFKIVFPKN